MGVLEPPSDFVGLTVELRSQSLRTNNPLTHGLGDTFGAFCFYLLLFYSHYMILPWLGIFLGWLSFPPVELDVYVGYGRNAVT